MKSLTVILMLFFALLATALHAEMGEEMGPANPREFHEQEFARVSRAMAVRPGHYGADTQDDFDAQYYELWLDFRGYYVHEIAGRVTVLARSARPDFDEMILDLCSALSVDSVTSRGSQRPYSLDSNYLHIYFDRSFPVGDTVSVQVSYHGIPCQTNNNFVSFQFYDRSVNGRYIPGEATLSEPDGARDWWPSKNVVSDKADSVRVSIIVADTLTATSNGLLESVTAIPPSGKKYTWVERHPISTYLVCASATNYAHYSDSYVTLSGATMPIDHYVYPERLSRAQTSWDVLPAMMQFDAQLLGEYPFVNEKYGHTMFSFGGAMEHQTNTSFGRNITPGTHFYDYIVQHELVHQWYGDAVTPETWRDVWLNEGFASYGEALWFEHLNGFAAYHSYMTGSYDLGVTDPSGPVYNPTDLFSSNTVYNKGAWILHMLRGVVDNDSLFFAALREYRARHCYGNATTGEFLSDVSDVIGYEVTPYLYSYLYLTNRPHYAVSSGSAMIDGAPVTVVRIRQTQSDPASAFQTRLELRFSCGADTAGVRVENSQWQQRYYLHLPFAAASLTVDPDDWVLKQVTGEPLPLTIMNDTLSEASLGLYYEQPLTALGGTGLGWQPLDALPEGLNLSPDGMLHGVPAHTGTTNFRVTVWDAPMHRDTTTLTLTVHGPLLPPQVVAYLQPGETRAISLAWPPVAEADSYRVYRAELAQLPTLQCIATTADTFLIDTLAVYDADSLAHRFYEVTAVRR